MSPELISNFLMYLLIDSALSLLWKLVTCMQMCTSLNYRKVKKAELSLLIPRKLTSKLKHAIV